MRIEGVGSVGGGGSLGLGGANKSPVHSAADGAGGPDEERAALSGGTKFGHRAVAAGANAGSVAAADKAVRPETSPGTKDAATDLLGESALDQLVEGLNRTLQAVDKRLQFLVHETTGRVHVKVIDMETEEVIREIPPEEMLDLVGRIHELVGLLVDETV